MPDLIGLFRFVRLPVFSDMIEGNMDGIVSQINNKEKIRQDEYICKTVAGLLPNDVFRWVFTSIDTDGPPLVNASNG